MSDLFEAISDIVGLPVARPLLPARPARRDGLPTAPTEPGKYEVDGVRFWISPGGNVIFRSDCERCVRDEGKGGPDHDAMLGCRSGGSAHCTCDGCY
ncbi:MAG: hypothetical protein AAGC66_04610 [Leifsonia sp.]